MTKLFSIAGLAAAAALTFAGSASAADMPLKAPPPPPVIATWTGTYIGINGGWAWATTDHTISTTGVTTGDFDQDGGFAGVTWGGNWQTGHLVLGFESDIDWADIKGSVNNVTVCGGTCFTKIKALSTERARVGY